MKKILITIAIVMLAMTTLTGCACGGKHAKATHAGCSATCTDSQVGCKGHKAACCGGKYDDCKGKKACCEYAGTAACCGKHAPDAKISCALGGCEVAAKDAVKIGDGKYACAHCAGASQN